ncbi:unnamed protein product [Bursaphelenchus okinawaensis]|uniref:Uncharacterized protein n=1 Tax=Bursaphelenchus okinawaensis TaxID=465554 RepID=A0A811LHJ7_9BILA|nr:unnamed protein product [Bursaphelenchus okinawaensis]CAG9123420.1 unnamed protein product [Bursaphelenchus okinawaensis]
MDSNNDEDTQTSGIFSNSGNASVVVKSMLQSIENDSFNFSSLSDIWGDNEQKPLTSLKSEQSLFSFEDYSSDKENCFDQRSYAACSTSGSQEYRAKWSELQDNNNYDKLNQERALRLPDLTNKTPLRPRTGTFGRKIELKSNHFELKLPRTEGFHYNVEFFVKGLPKYMKRAIFDKIIQVNSKLFVKNQTVFDGIQSLYTKNVLDWIEGDGAILSTGQFMFNNRKDCFNVAIKFEEKLSFKDLDGVFASRISMVRREIPRNVQLAVDKIMRAKGNLKYATVGDMFYEKRAEAVTLLGLGRELWYGFYQLAMPIERSLSINIDLSATTFYSCQSVLKLLAEVLEVPLRSLLEERKPIQESHRIKFLREIKDLKVEVTHIETYRRKYKVINVTKRTANSQTFPLDLTPDSTVDITVAEYFRSKYKKKLYASHLPCLQVGKESKHTFMPLEVCEIMKGQRSAKKLNDVQTSKMIKATAMNAVEREKKIEELVLESSEVSNPFADEFGFKLSSKMIQFDGRVLEAPSLLYTNPSAHRIFSYKATIPSKGVWDMRNKHFVKGVHVDHWAMVLFVSPGLVDNDKIYNYVNSLHTVAGMAGMYMNPNPVFCKYAAGVDQIGAILQYLKATFKDLQLVTVVLPGKTLMYAELKRLADTVYGIPTQCLKASNVVKISPQTLSNVCLKINAKLGGVNTILKPESRPKTVFGEPVVFMGARVTHSSPDDIKKRPSISTVTGSIDGHPSKYVASVRTQAREDYVVDMAFMVRELLVRFYKNTGFKPTRIVMYRGGVCTSKALEVLRYELIQMRKACMMLEAGYEPGITYILVEKTHHTRLFAANPDDRMGKASNVPAGTIVDTTITQPDEYDFYLCSHAGVQGTSRPAYYHVLWDDNKLSANELQTLTYQLCFTYVRCTRSISIPAPAYYAHLVAARARLHFQPVDSDDFAEEGENLPDYNKNVKIHENISNSMYFS